MLINRRSVKRNMTASITIIKSFWSINWLIRNIFPKENDPVLKNSTLNKLLKSPLLKWHYIYLPTHRCTLYMSLKHPLMENVNLMPTYAHGPIYFSWMMEKFGPLQSSFLRDRFVYAKSLSLRIKLHGSDWRRVTVW